MTIGFSLVSLILGILIGRLLRMRPLNNPVATSVRCDQGEIVFDFDPNCSESFSVERLETVIDTDVKEHSASCDEQELRHLYDSSSPGTMTINCTYSGTLSIEVQIPACTIESTA